MKAAINSVIRTCSLWSWIAHAGFRLVRGRFFVFREVPTWVLEELMEWGEPPEGTDPMTQDMYHQAKDELALRQRNELRGTTE